MFYQSFWDVGMVEVGNIMGKNNKKIILFLHIKSRFSKVIYLSYALFWNVLISVMFFFYLVVRDFVTVTLRWNIFDWKKSKLALIE